MVFKDMNRIDGMPMEFEWKIFPGITALGLLEKIQKLLTDLQCEPEHVNVQRHCMGRKRKQRTICTQFTGSCGICSQIPSWSLVLEPGSEEKWYGTKTHNKLDGAWDRTTQEMMAYFHRFGHPIFRASSAFARGELRSKGGGKKSLHFNGSHETIELLLRTVISANQLSIYGAIADLCDEVPKRVRAPGKPAAPDHLEKVEIPTVLSKAENSTNEQ